MKKVGILTINDYNNYGNRLQNYATQEVLTSLGVQAETVVNITEYINPIYQKKSQVTKIRIENLMNSPIRSTISKVNMRLNREKIENLKNRRKKAFKNFTTIHIKETDFTISEKNIPVDLGAKYDFFITGSDQVWNPNYRFGSSIDFLSFAPVHKRIAFSPSFGVSELPEKYEGIYTDYLKNMGKLSVREFAGAKLIRKLTGIEAPVLVDPTLVLSSDHWDSISRPHSMKPSQKYLLTYFLGSTSRKRRKLIAKISKQNNLKVINLGQISEGDLYIADPGEFLDFIRSAEVFLTDSFHGTVFSILFKTPFIVCDREEKVPSMNSRIDSLLSTFQLESRVEKKIRNNNQIFDIDFSHISLILDKERKKSLNYLRDSLNI